MVRVVRAMTWEARSREAQVRSDLIALFDESKDDVHGFALARCGDRAVAEAGAGEVAATPGAGAPSTSPQDESADTTEADTPESIVATSATSVASDDSAELVEQGWWPLLRASRQSDMAHLRGDIEPALDDVAPFWLDPGTRYTTSQLGSTISFEVDSAMALTEENPAMVVLRFPTTTGEAGILLMRPVGVFGGDSSSDPAAAVSRLAAVQPVPEDLSAFFDAVPALEVTDTADLDLDGVAARRYDIRVDAEQGGTYACQLGPSCVNSVLGGPTIAAGIVFNPDRCSRVYEIEQPDTDIVVIVNADLDDEQQLDAADRLVASITVDEPGPSPIDDMVWQLQTHLAALSRVVADSDGAPVADADALVGHIEAVLGEDAVTDVGEGEILGRHARVLDLDGPGETALLHYAIPPDTERWESGPVTVNLYPEASRVWIFELDDELWAAVAGSKSPDGLDAAVEWAGALFDRATLGTGAPS